MLENENEKEPEHAKCTTFRRLRSRKGNLVANYSNARIRKPNKLTLTYMGFRLQFEINVHIFTLLVKAKITYLFRFIFLRQGYAKFPKNIKIK